MAPALKVGDLVYTAPGVVAEISCVNSTELWVKIPWPSGAMWVGEVGLLAVTKLTEEQEAAWRMK